MSSEISSVSDSDVFVENLARSETQVKSAISSTAINNKNNRQDTQTSDNACISTAIGAGVNPTKSSSMRVEKQNTEMNTAPEGKNYENFELINYDGIQFASASNAAFSMSQAACNTTIPVSSVMKPLLVVAPNAMNMKNFNLQQIPILPGIQIAPVNSSLSSATRGETDKSQPLTTVAVVCTSSVPALPDISPETPSTRTAAVMSPTTPTNLSNWDPFGQSERVTVSCKKNTAVFDRRKLGSGQRGKCIYFSNHWMTPSEFETASGLSTSKDWKRSLRCGGVTLQKLISDGHLKPHSALCSCAVCSDDNNITCPPRLFQPYKRRKRSSTVSTSHSDKKPHIDDKDKFTQSTDHLLGNVKNAFAESAFRYALAEAQVNEQRMWWRLENMSENLIDQAQKLKNAIEEAKTNSLNQRILLMQKMVSHFGKDGSDQVSVSNSFSIDPISTKPSANMQGPAVPTKLVEQSIRMDPKNATTSTALQFCNTCGNEAVSECTGCRKATYCSTACQEKDWLHGHSEVCPASVVAEQTKSRAENPLTVHCLLSDVSPVVTMPTASVLPSQDFQRHAQPPSNS